MTTAVPDAVPDAVLPTESLDLDWMISVDDHVLEPPHVWQSTGPAKYKDRAPKLETDSTGERWVYDGRMMPHLGVVSRRGQGVRTTSAPNRCRYSEMRAGCYDPVALEDMDADRRLASLCFPSFPRFCGQLFWEATDKELALECVKAYNDWMIDEWCGTAPGRFIPLVHHPAVGPRAGGQGNRAHRREGRTAVAFSENPAPLGLPTIHDVPVLGPGNEVGRRRTRAGRVHARRLVVATSPDLARLAVSGQHVVGSVRTAGAMLEWLFSGLFQRSPN